MAIHKYKITWKHKGDIEFVTAFMKDFPDSVDEAQRVHDVGRLLQELPQYGGRNIQRIEEIE